MTEQQAQAIEIEDVETELAEVTVETVVEELTEAAFGTDLTVTPYKVAVIINKAFQALEVEKQIPTQMMYNYDRNGMISKGRKGVKAYSKDEVQAFATKYVNKYAN